MADCHSTPVEALGALLNGDGRRFGIRICKRQQHDAVGAGNTHSLVKRYHNADGTIPQLMENG